MHHILKDLCFAAVLWKENIAKKSEKQPCFSLKMMHFPANQRDFNHFFSLEIKGFLNPIQEHLLCQFNREIQI